MLVFIVSILSGIVSGMGIGGGTILIPALIILFNTGQHMAQSINLISFIPTGTAALITHLKNKSIEKKLSLLIIAGGILGAIAGSIAADRLSSPILRKLFGIFLFAMGTIEIFSKKK